MAVPTRDLLIAAATELLDAGGLDAVSLREVSHRVGVSHNAPYKHFADKEALLAAVAARELAALADTLEALRKREPAPEEALRAALHEYVTWARAHPSRFKLVFGTWTTDSEELGVAASRSRAVLMDTVAAAQRARRLPDGAPERLTALLQALVHGAVDLTLSGHLSAQGKGRADPDDLVDDLIAYLQAAAAPPHPAP